MVFDEAQSGQDDSIEIGKSQLPTAKSEAFDRIAFALCPSRNRTAHLPSGEKPEQGGLRRGAVRSLQSGLLRNYREKWASFAYFGITSGGISLQLRLAGGEGGIQFKPKSLMDLH